MATDLFSDFSPNTYQEWLEKVTKDLRGKPVDSLEGFTADHIKTHPLYTADFPAEKVIEQPKSADAAWVVVEEFVVENEAETNKQVLDKLNRGANGLLFYTFADVDIDALLKDVLMEHVSIHFVVEQNADVVLKNWLKVAEQRGVKLEDLHGSVNTDPIENAARTGNWQQDAEADLMQLNSLVADAPAGIKSLCVNANLYGNTGATPAQQLGLALAHAFEYLNRTGSKNAAAVWMNLAIGGQYFEEIAKFRAMRRLWQFLLQQLGENPTTLHIYAEAGFRNKTIYDPWVNMLRSTTECMSAAVGGADEILLRPYNATFAVGQEFGSRVARNQQLVLAYESYFNRVNDPAAGSYFVENLTEELANKGWEVFKEIEAQGGMIAALENGFVQDMIAKSARVEQEKFDAGELKLLGTNLYPNADEQMKKEVEEPLFGAAPQDTDIKPIVAKRLAEESEVERLNNE